MARVPGVLSNAADVLNLLAERSPCSVAEIAELLGMPRPSVYRMLDALQLISLVDTEEDGQFKLDTALLRLRDAAQHQIPEVVVARPLLQQINDATGFTVYLCTARDGVVRCLDWVRGTKVGLLILKPGGSLPPHAGATSRAILAYDDALRADVIARGRWDVFTDRTLNSAEAFESDARLVRERGYAVSDEDVTPGIAAIGVALVDNSGRLRGALSVAGLKDDVLSQEALCVGQLRDAARVFAAELG